jgi:hypothetical protein
MFRNPLITEWTRFVKRVNVTLLVLNLIGALIYLARASHGWRIPQEQEQGLDSITAEPYIWFICYPAGACRLSSVESVLGRARFA